MVCISLNLSLSYILILYSLNHLSMLIFLVIFHCLQYFKYLKYYCNNSIHSCFIKHSSIFYSLNVLNGLQISKNFLVHLPFFCLLIKSVIMFYTFSLLCLWFITSATTTLFHSLCAFLVKYCNSPLNSLPLPVFLHNRQNVCCCQISLSKGEKCTITCHGA